MLSDDPLSVTSRAGLIPAALTAITYRAVYSRRRLLSFSL